MSSRTDIIRVLLVNDQTDILHLWQRILNRYADLQCVATATDGRAALDESQRYTPDVVLMDIMMPGMDGLEATQHLRASRPDLSIILYSAHIGMSEKALRVGADEFVLMPVAPDRLIDIIRRVHVGKPR